MRRAARGSVLEWSRDEIYAGLDRAAKEIVIVSPFISAEIGLEVAQRAGASKARSLRLLTCLSPAATAAGVLDREALLGLLRADWELRSARNLHAKAALVDREWGVIGSGNLTVRGLGGEEIRANAELGVVLSREQVGVAGRIVSRWWKEAEPIGQEEIESCLPPQRGRGGRRSAIGPDVGRKPASVPKRADRERTGFWLKMIYDREERRGPEWWNSHEWLSDRHLLRNGNRPILQPSYQQGDLLVLYVVGRGCPAIVEVTRPAEYEPERVRDDPDAQAGDWKRWGWVTEVRCRHSVPVEEAPTLGEIGVESASVKRRGRIQLQPDQFSRARSALLRIQG